MKLDNKIIPMVSLAQTGLPINLNTSTCFLQVPNNLFEKFDEKIYKLEDLKDSLLNQDLENPEYIYSEYRGIYKKDNSKSFEQVNVHHNLIVLPSQMVGVEFSRSHIYTSKLLHENDLKTEIVLNKKKVKSHKFACVLEPILGSCIVLFQVRKPKESWLVANSPEIIEAGVVKLKKNEKFLVPTGYDFVVINVKNTPAIISKIYKQDFKLNYHSIQDARGMSHYIIRKNGRIEAVPNSHYKNIPKLHQVKHKEQMKSFGFDSASNLYEMFCTSQTNFDRILANFNS